MPRLVPPSPTKFEGLGVNQLRHYEQVLDNYLQSLEAYTNLLMDTEFRSIFTDEYDTLKQVRKELARRNAR